MASKKIFKLPKLPKRPLSSAGSSPGSGGLGPYLGGVKGNPALFPQAKEQ